MPESGKRRRTKSRPKKDRVLQARIPSQLDKELREHAEELGLSVSTVVRNTLLNTFQLVEGVVADSARVARAARRHTSPGETAAVPESDTSQGETGAVVVGWQEAILNLNGICDQCNTVLRRGERAAIGIPVQARPVILCLSCLTALSDEHPGDAPTGL